jgi:hypothetical protein
MVLPGRRSQLNRIKRKSVPPNVYLDQNALIYLHNQSAGDGTFKAKILQAIGHGGFIVVLSPWHWVETARTKDLQKASQLGEFIDWLNPIWLRDRRDLEALEVRESFFTFARVPFRRPASLVTRTELLSAMNGVELTPATTPSSREFVEGWIKKPGMMEPLIKSQLQNADALKSLRAAIASGKLTAAIKAEGDQKLIAGFLPNTTPNGVVIDDETKRSYLNTVTPKVFPTLAIESAVAEYSWDNQGRIDWNSMVDKFHLIPALHYTDLVISDDGYFQLLLPVAKKTGFVKASVLKFADFCKSFLQ